MNTTAQGITLPSQHCHRWVLQMFTYTWEGLLNGITRGQPSTSKTWKTDPAFCTLNIWQLSTSPANTSTYLSDNLRNLMTAIYSTLGTTWKFQVSYSCSTPTPAEESVCYTCTCVWEPDVYLILFCTRVVILQCFDRSWLLHHSYSGKGEKKRQKQFSVLLAMTFCWQYWVW